MRIVTFGAERYWNRRRLRHRFDVLSISALCAMEIAVCCFHSPPDYLLRTVLAQLALLDWADWIRVFVVKLLPYFWHFLAIPHSERNLYVFSMWEVSGWLVFFPESQLIRKWLVFRKEVYGWSLGTWIPWIHQQASSVMSTPDFAKPWFMKFIN